MTAYVFRRLFGLVAVLFGVSVLVFLTMHLRPGDPALIMLGPHATAESLARLRAEMGLDLPLPVQYWRWISNVLQGDWGRSIQLKHEVWPLLVQRFQNTALLTLFGVVLAVSFGVPAGIVSAVRQYSWVDRLAMVGMMVGFSIPVFWLGLMLQLYFGQKLGWLPLSGVQTPGSDPSWGDFLLHAILPAVTLAAGPGAVIARMTRSAMLEVVRQDFVRTAHAKGLPDRRVVYKHALKNALIPVMTVIGMQVGYLLGGEILLEMVFSWPGLGLLMVNGILAQDFPVVQGAILVVASIYVVINLFVDLLYAKLDPRITYGVGGAA